MACICWLTTIPLKWEKKNFIYPYDFVMKLCQVKEEEKINSCQEINKNQFFESVWLRGIKNICLVPSPFYMKIIQQWVYQGWLPFSLIRSLIACHFMSYGMLLMKTLFRFGPFFSPVPEFLSFE